MSTSNTQPSQLILARLRDPHASSDQFTWPELQKVYADHVSTGGAFVSFIVFGGTIAGLALLNRLVGLSPGGTLAAFVVILWLLAGTVHYVLNYRFHLLSFDTAFAKVQEWAVAHAPAPAAKAGSRFIAPLLVVGVLIAAALTLPEKSKHEAELRQAITVAINSADTKTGGDVLGKAGAWLVNAAFKDDAHASYIDFFDLEYHKFAVFSVVKDKKGQVISIGAFNQVYVRELSPKHS